MNIGIGSNGALQQLPLSSSWSLGGNEKFGVNSAASWPFAGNHSSGVPYENPSNQAPPVMKEWRNGDWICNCGFHNYSSRAQCKKCNASIPPGYTTLGTKRLASEEFVHDWDNKRLNSGYTNGQQKMYPGVGQVLGSAVDMKMGVYAPYAGVSSERSNGVMETGCAQIATIIIMHPVQSVIGARLKKKQWFSQSVRRSYKAAEVLDCCSFAGSHCSKLAKNMKECCTPVSLP